MIITKQKSITDKHIKKRKEYKHNARDSHQITKGENKEESNKTELQMTQK